jgi:hypothetical protein
VPHKDPAARRAYRVAYDAAHREDNVRRQTAWVAAHPAARKAYKAAYDAAHREEIRAYQSTYYAAYGAAVVALGGEVVNFNTMPPQLREVAVLLKQVRKATQNMNAGGNA